MRDFLCSEIAAYLGISNVPHHPDLAIEAGTRLCQDLLEPLQATFGRVAVRSSYRSPEINDFGNQNGLNCASNQASYGHHNQDYRDKNGALGATACVAIPESGTDSRSPATGGGWPGGSTTTCPMAHSVSSPSCGPSTSSGASGRRARSGFTRIRWAC